MSGICNGRDIVRRIPLAHRRSNTRYTLIACLSLSAGGCSFPFVKGPPIGHEQLEYFRCTESRTFPILDVIGVAVSLLDAATVEDDPNIHLAFAVSFGASAWTGYRRVNECRAARLESARRSAPPPDPLAVPADEVPWLA